MVEAPVGKLEGTMELGGRDTISHGIQSQATAVQQLYTPLLTHTVGSLTPEPPWTTPKEARMRVWEGVPACHKRGPACRKRLEYGSRPGFRFQSLSASQRPLRSSHANGHLLLPALSTSRDCDRLRIRPTANRGFSWATRSLKQRRGSPTVIQDDLR